MKRLIILPLLLLTLSLGATKIYVATTGDDDTGDGSSGNPYETIAKGISEASATDTVYIVAGTHAVSAQLDLPVDISLMGEGATSIISSTYSYTEAWPSTSIATLRLRSTSEGTEGNQSISYLKFDGNSLTATAAICVSARSNVTIHNCDFVDFLTYGVSFTGTVDFSYGEATTYATGNSFHDNTMSDCAVYNSGGRGSLMIGSDEGMLIYDNTFVESLRGGSSYPYSIDKICYGFHKGLKIYDNSMGGVELWYIRGGHEFYDNVLNRAVDYGGIDAVWGNEDINDDGGYGYGAKIYRNTIGGTAYVTAWLSGINLEQTIKGKVYIYQNRIFKRPVPVMFSPSNDDCSISDIWIYANLFYNIGRTGSPLAYGVWIKTTYDNVTVSNINIWNNVMVSEASPYQYAGICFGRVSGDSISIKNNIITGAADYAITFDAGDTLDVVLIEKNLFYNNAHANAINVDATSVLTNKTEDNLTPANPLFKSNETFRLQPTSPAIDSGVDVGLTADYWGHRVPQNSTPDVGACEYGNYVLFYNGKQLY